MHIACPRKPIQLSVSHVRPVTVDNVQQNLQRVCTLNYHKSYVVAGPTRPQNSGCPYLFSLFGASVVVVFAVLCTLAALMLSDFSAMRSWLSIVLAALLCLPMLTLSAPATITTRRQYLQRTGETGQTIFSCTQDVRAGSSPRPRRHGFAWSPSCVTDWVGRSLQRSPLSSWTCGIAIGAQGPLLVHSLLSATW